MKTGIGWPHDVTKDQLEITYFKGSGPGGQNKNKRETACRMKHIPTGLVSQAQEYRTQEENKKAAFHRLCEQLVPIMKREEKKTRYAAGIGRIRTYTEKENRVKDDRIEDKTYPYDRILEGDMDELFQDLAIKYQDD